MNFSKIDAAVDNNCKFDEKINNIKKSDLWLHQKALLITLITKEKKETIKEIAQINEDKKEE